MSGDDVKIKFTGDATDAVDAAEKVAKKLEELKKKEADLKAAQRDAGLQSQMSGAQKRALAEEVKKATDEVNKATGGTNGLKDALTKMGPVIGAVSASIATLTSAYHAFSEQTKELGQVESFQRMGGDVDGLVRALDGMVDGGTAVRIASMARGLGMTNEQMIKLAGSARDVARITGSTTAEAFEKLAKSVGTGSAEMLSGIIPANTFELAVARLAKTTGKSSDQMEAHEKIGARMAAIHDSLGVAAVNAGGEVAKLGDSYERANAAITNTISSVKDIGAEAFLEVAQAIVEVTEVLDRLVDGFRRLGNLASSVFGDDKLSEVFGEWKWILDDVREMIEAPLDPASGLMFFARKMDELLKKLTGLGFLDFVVPKPEAEDVTETPVFGERPQVARTVVTPRKKTPEQVEAEKQAQQQAAQRDVARQGMNEVRQLWGDLAAQLAIVPAAFGSAFAVFNSLEDIGKTGPMIEQTADAYDEYLASVTEHDWGAMAEESMAARAASDAFWQAQEDGAKEAKAALEEQANASLLSFGQSFVGGSFDVAALGDAIGAAAGVPMAGQIAQAILDVVGGFVDGVVQTIAAIVGDERFGGAMSSTMGSMGAGALAGVMAGIVALPGIILGATIGPIVALFVAATSIVTVPLLALNGAIVALVGVIGGAIGMLAAMPVLAVAMPVFAAHLSTSTQSFARFQGAMSVVVDRMVAAMEPLWEGMLWLVGVFDVVASMIEPFLAAFANADIGSVLFDAVKLVAVAFGIVALGAGYLSNVFIGVATMLGPLIGMSEEQTEALRAYHVNTNALIKAVAEARSMTLESATAAGESAAAQYDLEQSTDDLDNEIDDVTNGVQQVNVPTGYKTAGAIFDAANPEGRGGAGGMVDASTRIVVENWWSSGDAESDFSKLKRLARFGHKGAVGTSRRFGDNKN